MVLLIGTLNCRGGANKIELLINTIIKSNVDILGLQETHHINENQKKQIERKCYGKIHLSNGTSSSRGVATFVKSKDGLHDKGTIGKDGNGRSINISVEYEGSTWNVFNAYAPNEARKRHDFFVLRNEELQKCRDEKRIYLGDFNNVLDIHMDRTTDKENGVKVKTDSSMNTLREIIKQNNMIDSYRHTFPNGVNYTFTGVGNYRARLDRIYIDEEIANIISDVKTQCIPYSDHDLVLVTLGEQIKREKWGRGRWILNKKLLLDEQTQGEISEAWKEWKDFKQRFKSILDWWDNGKALLADIYKVNGKRMQREMKEEVIELERELEYILAKTNTKNDDINKIRQMKRRLTEIEEGKNEASRIRSKEEWLDKRENCSRYFYEEERRRGNLKSMRELKIGDQIVKDKNEIVDGAKQFYKNLYRKENLDKNAKQKLVDKNMDKRLTDVQKDSIEGIIKKDEILKVLKGMKNDKSPGLDGLTREFYVMNWKLIGDDLADVTANVYLQDRLPETWTEGLITLIYKEKGDIRELKNWRPITLLNTDYKLYSKAIADRLRIVTGDVVDLDQGCGLEGRTIHDQLYFIRDFMDYYKETKQTALLMTIDQEKAFDRVDHDLMIIILTKLNFGPMIIGQIQTIYGDMKSRLMINGHVTETFDVTRSVRQGDGLSMVLFIIVAELLAQMIRKEMEITSIKLPNSLAKKLTQYADDTTIMTENRRSLNSLRDVLEKYEDITGAKINKDKTEIVLIGPWTKKRIENLPDELKGCIKDSITILGVWFGKRAKQLNEDMLTEKTTIEMEKWTNRDLSMTGKISALRTFVLSKIWHVAKVTGLQKKFITRMYKKMTTFFWAPKTFHCINKETLQNDRKSGGLSFPDIELEIQAYFLENIKIAFTNPEKVWVGMLKYRMGKKMEKIDETIKNKNTKYAPLGQTTLISRITLNALDKIKDNVINWEKINHKKIKKILIENVTTTDTDGNTRNEDCFNIHKSSRNLKRQDLNYLIAHTRLPLALFLSKINVTRNANCRLCDKHPETQEHLFFTCTKIKDLRTKVDQDILKINGTPLHLTYPIITMHVNIKSSQINEILSIYKQCIWQVRGAIFSQGGEVKIKRELNSLYHSKTCRFMKRTSI